jgi:hypothetical protein
MLRSVVLEHLRCDNAAGIIRELPFVSALCVLKRRPDAEVSALPGGVCRMPHRSRPDAVRWYRHAMTATEFLQAFAAEVGAAAPTAEETDALLELATIAAHASERLAAPLTCWIGGASGLPASELLAAARRIAPGVR